MPWYIKSPEWEYFVGSFLGLGFFEIHIDDGDCSEEERPIEFESQEEAQTFLNSWVGGTAGCFVTNEPSKRVMEG